MIDLFEPIAKVLVEVPELTDERALHDLQAPRLHGQVHVLRQRIGLLRPRARPCHALRPAKRVGANGFRRP
jgi:hypothetical protein